MTTENELNEYYPAKYAVILARVLVSVSALAESGAISMSAMTQAQEVVFRDILLSHFPPSKYADVLTERTERADLKAQVAAAITRLEQIKNAATPTNAQVIAAIRDMATYEEVIIKVLVRLV
jgi:hypothetical protein